MRLLVSFSLLGLLVACSGDSSSVMSVWNDPEASGTGGAGGSSGLGGQKSGGGGNGGQGLVPKGGSGGLVIIPISAGGSGGSVTGSVPVRGGTRDAQTAQCITTSSGGGCPFTAADLKCVQGVCGTFLRACYQGTTGVCADYAKCMLDCPCDSGRSVCESTCLQNKAMNNANCSMCALDLVSCYSKNGCLLPTCAGGSTT